MTTPFPNLIMPIDFNFANLSILINKKRIQSLVTMKCIGDNLPLNFITEATIYYCFAFAMKLFVTEIFCDKQPFVTKF